MSDRKEPVPARVTENGHVQTKQTKKKKKKKKAVASGAVCADIKPATRLYHVLFL
jgi:hypothetical protein